LDEGQLRQLLNAVARGELPTDDAMRRLASLPFEDLGFARVDHHRPLRSLGPEVVYARGKTPEETATIVSSLLARPGAPVLVTKASQAHAHAVLEVAPGATWHPRSGMLVARRVEARAGAGLVLVACAGTSDLPVAEEAWVTAGAFGCRVERLVDVGVAGAHRLFADARRLQAADVVIVVAGMEGALPSVVGGLVAAPVIAVPTSVGYGAAFDGLAALLGMLTSCAVGVAVVNIDNGFGAGALAARILAARKAPQPEANGLPPGAGPALPATTPPPPRADRALPRPDEPVEARPGDGDAP
jgi:pyridinium-3,5-biscarboxylic acid mononucleotide synthase